MSFIVVNSNFADVVSGERIFPGERVFDTGFSNRKVPYYGNGKTRLIKEETIVELAEAAGYVVTKRDGVNSGESARVDGEDVSVGGGEASVGKAPTGGKSASKRRSGGASKG